MIVLLKEGSKYITPKYKIEHETSCNRLNLTGVKLPIVLFFN